MAEANVSPELDRPVGQEVIALTITSGTSGEVTVPIHGLIKSILVVAPDLTTDTNFTLSILDEDDDIWFTKATINDNGDRVIHPREETGYGDVPCCGLTTILIDHTTTSQTSSWGIKIRYWSPKL